LCRRRPAPDDGYAGPDALLADKRLFHHCAECGPNMAWPSPPAQHAAQHSAAALDLAFRLGEVRLLPDFVSEAEERALLAEIDARPWVESQSGRRKQDYGPQPNFKRRRLKLASFSGLPAYWGPLAARLAALPWLADFHAVELCNLEYQAPRGAGIEPHVDDRWLWGERLLTLSLLSDCALTLTPPPDAVGADAAAVLRVPLPRRSLLMLAGDARHHWLHAVRPADVRGRRVSVVLRELSAELRATPDGVELERRAAMRPLAGLSVREWQLAAADSRPDAV